MPRWRVLLIALALVGVGAWALLTLPDDDVAQAPPHADIDDASREALEEVLRATRDEAPGR